MRRVVADHEHVDEAAAHNLGGERPLMARQPEHPHLPALLGAAAELQRTAGPGDLVPFFARLDVVERQHVDVIAAQFMQQPLQLALRIGGGARLELGTHDDRTAARTQVGDRATQIVG